VAARSLPHAELAAFERLARIPQRLEAALAMEHWPPERRAAWVRERLAALGVAADAPITERADVRGRVRPAGPVVERVTSGSTGRPVRVWHGPATVGWAAAARLRQLAWFGLGPGPQPQANMRIAAAPDDPLWWEDPRHPSLVWINPYALAAGRATELHEALVARGGVRLVGAESSLLEQWALAVRGAGVDGRELGIALAVAGGEMTFAAQREAAAGAFGCAVADMYGSHECGILATQCPEGSMHVAEEAVRIELVDAAGRPVGAGRPGEVVVTLLHNAEQPLVRYRLGDVARFVAGTCACGRTLARLDVELGRREDMVVGSDGALLHPRFLRTLYERRFGDALVAFHTVQSGPAAFRVRLELTAPAPPGTAEALAEGIGAYVGRRVEVALETGAVRRSPGKLRTFTRQPT